jgi:hypothetical protein
LVSLSVMAVVLVVVVPAARNDEALKVVAASAMIASDVEYVQSLTLASPDDPAVLCVSEDGSSYWIALASEPETPISRPYSEEPYQIVFGEGRASSLEGVLLTLLHEDDQLSFDAFGRIASGDAAAFVLEVGDDAVTVWVSATTGSVSIVAGVPEQDDPIVPETETKPGTEPAEQGDDGAGSGSDSGGGLLGGVGKLLGL